MWDSELWLYYRVDFQGFMAAFKEFSSGLPFLLCPCQETPNRSLICPPVWDHHQDIVIFAHHKLNFRPFSGLRLCSEIKHESLKHLVTSYPCNHPAIISSFLNGLRPAAAPPPFLNWPSTIPPPYQGLGKLRLRQPRLHFPASLGLSSHVVSLTSPSRTIPIRCAKCLLTTVLPTFSDHCQLLFSCSFIDLFSLFFSSVSSNNM